ncbi:MAG: amidohydrolase family protein [Nitrospirae bacterium]|nr:amidohydrolase family protein [Nitrospirota bacterium]
MNIIDFHTHIFPDEIAQRALSQLSEHSGDYRPHTDGTLSGLLSSMEEAGIVLSIVANIATKPSQVVPILEFCKKIKGRRIYPLISIHPHTPHGQIQEVIKEAKASGIYGIKLHPMYQDFEIDSSGMFPIYELIIKEGFFVVFHTGYDIAFPGNHNADLERLAHLAGHYPELRIVATHLGGWRQWDRVSKITEYENVYTEISMTMTEMTEEEFLSVLSVFNPERVFFGTDSPWTDQKEMVQRLMALPLTSELKEKLLFRNALNFISLWSQGQSH